MRIYSSALVASLFGALTLSACSPAQNWRDVAFEGSALKVQLPCKPDRTARSVPLGGVPVELQVMGCESGSAMVAVMSAALPAGSDASAVMTAWQKATLDNARVTQPLAAGQQLAWHRPGLNLMEDIGQLLSLHAHTDLHHAPILPTLDQITPWAIRHYEKHTAHWQQRIGHLMFSFEQFLRTHWL